MYLTEVQAKELTGFSLSKLRVDRMKKVGIPYLKIGKFVRYRPEDIEAFMDKHLIETEEGYR